MIKYPICSTFGTRWVLVFAWPWRSSGLEIWCCFWKKSILRTYLKRCIEVCNNRFRSIRLFCDNSNTHKNPTFRDRTNESYRKYDVFMNEIYEWNFYPLAMPSCYVIASFLNRDVTHATHVTQKSRNITGTCNTSYFPTWWHAIHNNVK